jgi:hypothetical protein
LKGKNMQTLVSIGSRHWQLTVGQELRLTKADLVGQIDVWSEACRITITVDENVWYERKIKGIFRFHASPETTLVTINHEVKQPPTLQFFSSLALGLQGYPKNLPPKLRIDERLLLECQETLNEDV